MAKEQKKLEQYAEYINSHTEEIAQRITEVFDEQKGFLKASILSYVKEHYLTPVPTHKVETEYHSCELVNDGPLSLDLNLYKFLEEFTGKFVYEDDGTPLDLETYRDAFENYVGEIGQNFVTSTIRKELEEKFGGIVSDKALEDVDDIVDFEEKFYEYNQLSSPEKAIEYLGIDDITLRQIVGDNPDEGEGLRNGDEDEIAENHDLIEKCLDLINEEYSAVVDFISVPFELPNVKDYVAFIKKTIIGFLTPEIPPHYQLEGDKLKKKGNISPESTVDKFLDEYTGERGPISDEDNCEYHFIKYSHKLRKATYDYAISMVKDALKTYFFAVHRINTTDNDLEQILDDPIMEDVINDSSVVIALFSPQDYDGINDLTLCEILNKPS